MRCTWSTRQFGAVLVALTVGSLVLLAGMTPAAADPGPRGVYPGPNWLGPDDAQGYQQIDRVVVPEVVVPHLFWSTTWEAADLSPGGYEGIQTDGFLPGVGESDMAIFSVWNAVASVPGIDSECGVFDGEGSGLSCRAALPVVAGDHYAIHVAADHSDSAGLWWHGTVSDTTAGITVDLGLIEADTTEPASPPADFMEFFGDSTGMGCDQYPYAVGDFDTPLLTPAGGGAAVPATLDAPGAAFCGETSNWTLTSDGVRVEFGGPKPSPITNLTAVSSGGAANLSWSNPISDGGSPILETRVESSTDGGTTWPTVTTVAAGQTSVALTGLNPSTDSVRLAAVNAEGIGGYSNIAALPPANNAFVNARAISGALGTLTGTNRAATTQPGEPRPGGLTVGHSLWYRYTPTINGTLSLGTCGSNFDTVLAVYRGVSITALTPVAFNNQSCGDQSRVTAAVTSGVTYRIVLAGYAGHAGTYALHWSFVAPPTAPRSPAAIPGAGQATVSWSAPLANNGSAVSAYVVTPYLGGVAGSPRVFNSAATTESVAGLTNGKTYTFKIAARNAGGTGSPSVATAPITVGAPRAPSVVTVAKTATGGVKVSFTVPANNGAPIASYTASCTSTNGGVTNTKVAAAGPITITGLTPGKTYRCTVKATNTRGAGPSSSASASVVV